MPDLGVLPIDHLRNLQIRVKYEHLDFDPSYTQEAIVSDIFSNLLPLTNRTQTSKRLALQHVEYILMTAFDNHNSDRSYTQFIALLESVRFSIYHLKYVVHADVRVLHHDEGRSPFPRDVTSVFALTEAQWIRVCHVRCAHALPG